MCPFVWKTAGEFPQWAGDDCTNGHIYQDIRCTELESRSINAPKYSLLKRETALIMTIVCTSFNFTGHYKCLHLPLLLESWFLQSQLLCRLESQFSCQVAGLFAFWFQMNKIITICREQVGLSKEFEIYKLLYTNEILSQKSRIPMRATQVFFLILKMSYGGVCVCVCFSKGLILQSFTLEK